MMIDPPLVDVLISFQILSEWKLAKVVAHSFSTKKEMILNIKEERRC